MNQFEKQPLNIDEQVSFLKEKNMVIVDENEFKSFLKKIGFFRFRGYALVFQDSNKNYFDNTTEKQIRYIYEFDQELRSIVSKEIEKIEILFRSVMANELSYQYQTPNWYTDASLFNFKPKFNFGNFLTQLENETRLSKDPYFMNYFSKYTNPPMPPIWAISEHITFGKWSILYDALKSGKNKIAREFGLTPHILSSWLYALTRLRNHCAHHARIWDRRFIVAPAPSQELEHSIHFTKPHSFYTLACILIIINDKTFGDREFVNSIKDLRKRYPEIDFTKMGYIKDWGTSSLWM